MIGLTSRKLFKSDRIAIDKAETFTMFGMVKIVGQFSGIIGFIHSPGKIAWLEISPESSSASLTRAMTCHSQIRWLPGWCVLANTGGGYRRTAGEATSA